MSFLKRLLRLRKRGMPSVSALSEGPDQVPVKRIAAFLVLMQTKRDDGDELCERLLDDTQTDLQGKPRRFFIDNDTWYDFWFAEPTLPIVNSISRVLDDTADEREQTVLALVMRQLHKTSGVQVSVKNLRLSTFAYDGQDGATISIVQDRDVLPTSVLRCRKCGEKFDFSAKAAMVTVEQLFSSGGGIVITHESNLERPAPDLIAGASEPSGRGVATEVLSALRGGKYRRWHHQGCDAIMGYPGAFFRTGVTR